MVTLMNHTLTIEEMKQLLFTDEQVQACSDSMKKVVVCREVVKKIVDNGKVVYGITMGEGQ